ncbi:Uncharacterised protein [Mycobacteroides abscessus subsp. massiliense]|uniref:hypothetical protein n=1 Tax=Mycobacteroides abscessus TaxID=36809 RepID=UPI0009D10A5C|nr:hypothetical protein [Mycobacteroides abscessus]SLI10630.1 Uncharacterised protein [Mycobacteroides abscessus subsp. massiliense]
MAPVLSMSFENVRAGANKLDDVKKAIAAIAVPDVTAAVSGLTGLSCAGELVPAHDAMKSSLNVAGGRYETMGTLIRNVANIFERESSSLDPKAIPEILSTRASNALVSVGELNTTR